MSTSDTQFNVIEGGKKHITVTAFNETLQKSNAWIQDILEESGWPTAQAAYSALRATLHTLRDRLPIEEATDFAAEFPMLIRGMYYEGWTPIHKPDKSIKTAEDFLERVRTHFRNSLHIDSEEMVAVVFKVLSKNISSGEVRQVRQNLPERIRELWPESFQALSAQEPW